MPHKGYCLVPLPYLREKIVHYKVGYCRPYAILSPKGVIHLVSTKVRGQKDRSLWGRDISTLCKHKYCSSIGHGYVLITGLPLGLENKKKVVEVHFSCILTVILTLPLRLSGPLLCMRGCRRTLPAFGPCTDINVTFFLIPVMLHELFYNMYYEE